MKLDRALFILREEICRVDGHDEYAIFGSAALVLRGIIQREPGDVDVMVTPRVWGALLPRAAWKVETPKAGDPQILVWPTSLATETPLHLFFDWRDDAVEIDPSALLREAELVRGFRCATIQEILRHKRAAFACLGRFPSVAKHEPDIAAIERHLEATDAA